MEKVVSDPATIPLQPLEADAIPRAKETVRENWLLLSGLVLLGGFSSIAYFLGFARPYLLEQYYLKPLQDLAKINGATNSAANAWALAWVIAVACYFLAFRFCPAAEGVSKLYKRLALGIIVGWAAIFSLTLLFMYPTGAADLFDQIFRARLTTQYGLNPFTTLPLSIEGDPLRPFVAWQGDPSPYGPVWELLAAGASWLATDVLAGDVLWNNLIVFKILVIAAYGGSIALVYATLRAWKPEWALRGTLFFAWNPLVLFEVAGNGHNDAVVAFFLLLAVYLFVKGWRWAILPALALGALTKFIPALLVPIAIAAIWRDRRTARSYALRATVSPQTSERSDARSAEPRSTADVLQTLAVGIGLSGGLAILLYAPFWVGPESIGALGRQTLFTASIPKVVLDWLVFQMGVAEPLAQGIVRWGALALVGLAVAVATLWVLLWRPRVPDDGAERRYELRASSHETTDGARSPLLARTLPAFYEIIFVYLAFATLWFQPWYLLWLVALTAPLASYTHSMRTLLFCVGAILHYFVWDFVWLWNRSPMREIQITDVLIVYTMPLFYTLYVLLRRKTINNIQPT
jgi:hypothetical protein